MPIPERWRCKTHIYRIVNYVGKCCHHLFCYHQLVGMFIERIHVIREGVERIASGNYSKKIKSKKSFLFKKQEDEFDYIINGINHMQLEVAKEK